MHRRASDGALLLEGYAAREGVLEYIQPDGSVVRELVSRQAVEDTARTLARSAVTLDHPPEFVDPDNVQVYGIGDVDGASEVEELAQGGFVRVKLSVRRRDGLDAIGVGTHELSAGYDVQIDPTPGVHPKFGAYDAIQVRRDCNHLAIVERGRAGPRCSVRVDAWAEIGGEMPTETTNNRAGEARTDKGKWTMNPRLSQALALLGITERIDSDDAGYDLLIAGIKQVRLDAKKAEEDAEKKDVEKKDELERLKEENDALKAERDALKAEAEKRDQEEQKKRDEEEKKDLEELAEKVDVKTDGLTLPQLRVAIAKTRLDSVDETTHPAALSVLIESARREARRGDTGREAGFKAWVAATRPHEDHGSRQDAAGTGEKSLTQRTLDHYNAMFRRARGDK